MRYLPLLILALLLPTKPLFAAATDDVVVIVNSDNPSSVLSKSALARIYRNNQLQWDWGGPVIIYDLMPSNPVREHFSDEILGTSASRIAERWAHLKITNQAVNPPIELRSEWMIIRRVSQQRNAIGYVSSGMLQNAESANVKVLYTIHQSE